MHTGSKFIASSPAGYGIESTDGKNWKEIKKNGIYKNFGLAFGNRIVVNSSDGGPQMYYSEDDGATWNSASVPNEIRSAGIAFGDGIFVSVGRGLFSSNTKIATYSIDAKKWNTSELPASANWKAVAYGNGRFVAITGGYYNVSGSTGGENKIAAYVDVG